MTTVGTEMRADGWWFTSRTNRVKRVYHHLRAFGLRNGSRSLFQAFQPYGRLIHIAVPGYPAPVTLRAGTSDVYSFEKILVDGEYSHAPLRNPRCVIDAGANIGCSAVYFARMYPDARILAVEPNRDNYELLVRNTRAYPNVHPVHAALWGRSAALAIENPSRSTDSFVVREGDPSAGSAETVRAVTVEELLAEAGCPKADLVKIDIESAEKELFEGGDNGWLRDVSVIMIELHDRIKPGCSAAFYRAVCPYDFVQDVFGEVVVITKAVPGGETGAETRE